jgi:hypothetical protein
VHLESRDRLRYNFKLTVRPFKIKFGGTWVMLYLSWHWLKNQEQSFPYEFDFLIDLAFTIFLIWILSRLFKQYTKVYGVILLRKLGYK